MSQDANVPAEPPSDEGTPDAGDDFQQPGSAPGDEPGDLEGEGVGEPGEELEPPLGDEPGDEPDEGAAGGEDDEDEAWRNFEAKFQHIKNPRDRRAAMGRAWWDKINYAAQVRKENEDARAELARIAGAKTPDADGEPEAPPTNPHIEKLDTRIKSLVQKDEQTQATQQKQLVSLADADKAIAKLEAHIEIAKEGGDEYKAGLLEARLEAAQLKRTTIVERYQDLDERRQQMSYDMEKLLQDRDWAQNVYKNQAQQQQQESQRREQFNAEFPQFVDAQITREADSLGAPKDQKIRRGLWKHVNQAMMVDLYRLGEQGIEEVDVPSMIQGYVKEYLEDRDIAVRQRFNERSRAKRSVTGRAPSAQAPGRGKAGKPIPASLMGTSDQTPAMLRARQYLATKNL
jgi:hypothetical protein